MKMKYLLLVSCFSLSTAVFAQEGTPNKDQKSWTESYQYGANDTSGIAHEKGTTIVKAKTKKIKEGEEFEIAPAPKE